MSKLIPATTPTNSELLNDLIPAPKSGGRPREVDMWRSSTPFSTSSVRDAVGGPLGRQVYTYFRNWRKDGTWVRIHDSLRQWVSGTGATTESIGSHHRQSKQECSNAEPGCRV